MVRLVEIDEHNLQDVLRVRTAPHQEDYVADNGRSIAEGLLCTPPGWYRAVYDADVCVGFVMLAHFDDPAHKLYHRYHGWYLWRLLIGAAHQRRGYATQVMHLVYRRHRRAGRPAPLDHELEPRPRRTGALLPWPRLRAHRGDRRRRGRRRPGPLAGSLPNRTLPPPPDPARRPAGNRVEDGSGEWQTASTLLPSGSRTNAP